MPRGHSQYVTATPRPELLNVTQSLGVGSVYTSAVLSGANLYRAVTGIFKTESGNATLNIDQGISSGTYEVNSSVVVSAGQVFALNQPLVAAFARLRVTSVVSATRILLNVFGSPVT